MIKHLFIIIILCLSSTAYAGGWTQKDYDFCENRGHKGDSFYSCLGGRVSKGGNQSSTPYVASGTIVFLLVVGWQLIVLTHADKPSGTPITNSNKKPKDTPKETNRKRKQDTINEQPIVIKGGRFTSVKPCTANSTGLLAVAEQLHRKDRQ